VYAGYVEQARTYGSLGYPLTGGSFMQVASEEMHLTLLPATRAIYARENVALATASAGATGLPWIVITVALAALIGIVLYRAQRWLRRRTHRVVNLGLLAASVAVTAAVLWLGGGGRWGGTADGGRKRMGHLTPARGVPVRKRAGGAGSRSAAHYPGPPGERACRMRCGLSPRAW
jgi:hypothetical protein